jgi:glucokinase
MAALTLGLDVGGTNIKAVLLDPARRVVRRGRWRTAGLGVDGAEIVSGLVVRVGSLLRREGITAADLRGLGLACAGLVNRERGLIEDSPNLAPWVGVPLGRLLSEQLAIAVTLENDVNALAWGEWKLGAGKGTSNLVCLGLGTGVGGGLILDGTLYTGHRGLGAELGHLTIERNGRLCACGNHGCLEAYTGAAAITRAARRALARKRPGWQVLADLCAGQDPDPARLSRAARDGSELARELLAGAGQALGVAIANYVNIFAPEVVVIAGGVSRAGKYLLTPAREEATARLMDPATQVLNIRIRNLGDDGAAIGVALLARERS